MSKIFKVLFLLSAAAIVKSFSLELDFLKFMPNFNKLQTSLNRFEVKLEQVVQLSDTKFVDCTNLKVYEVLEPSGKEKKSKIVGNITINQKLDESSRVVVKVFRKQASEYRLLPFSFEENLCDHFRDDVYYFKEFCRASWFSKPLRCPIEPVSRSNFVHIF
jgi:hypothetical protein